MSFPIHHLDDEHAQRTLAGIAELLKTRPYTLDMMNNPAAVAAVERRMLDAGVQPLSGHSELRFENEGYTTLVGRKGNGNGPRVALVFHYDIAPDEATWQIDDKHIPRVVETKHIMQHMDPEHVTQAGERVIVGKGVADMLGAAEAMLQAAAAIPDDLPGECMIIATPDEERWSVHGMIPLLHHLADHDQLPDIVIGAESTFMDVLVRRRGGYYFDVTLPTEQQLVFEHHYRIVTHGTNMHPGVFTVAKRGFHANLKMAQVLGDIGEHQVLEIVGGDTVNVIPNRCEAIVATREPIHIDQLESGRVEIEAYHHPLQNTADVILHVRDSLEAIAQLTPPVETDSDFGISVSPNVINNSHINVSSRIMQGDPDLLRTQLEQDFDRFGVKEAVVAISGSIQPFFSDAQHPAIQTAIDVVRSAGWTITGNRENYGTSDLNFLYEYPDVIGFEIGAIGANEHGANEWVSVDSLLALPAIYADVVQRICDQEAGV